MVSWKLAQIPKFNLLIMACCKLVVYDRVPGNLGSWVFPKSYSTNLFGWVYISQGYAIVLRRGCQQLLVRVLPGNWIYPSQIAEGHLNGMNGYLSLPFLILVGSSPKLGHFYRWLMRGRLWTLDGIQLTAHLTKHYLAATSFSPWPFLSG
jgi:hypothetical protein